MKPKFIKLTGIYNDIPMFINIEYLRKNCFYLYNDDEDTFTYMNMGVDPLLFIKVKEPIGKILKLIEEA